MNQKKLSIKYKLLPATTSLA